MKKVPARDLRPSTKIESDMYHSSGELLLSTGRLLSPEILRSLEKAGISEVVFVEPGEGRSVFRTITDTEPVSISDFTEGQALQENIYGADGVLLFSEGDTLTKDVLDSLHGRGESVVYVRRTPDAARVRRFIGEYAKEKIESLDKKVSRGEVELSVQPEGLPYRRLMVERRGAGRSHSDKAGMMQRYKAVCAAVKAIFDNLINNKAVGKNEVCRIIDSLCEAVLTDREMTVAVSSMPVVPENYYVPHSVLNGVLSILTGLFMGYNEEQVKLLALVGLFHDIGMLRIPERIVCKSEALSPEEESRIRMHPEVGVGLALRILIDEDVLPLVTYQTHERQTGVGYPRKLREEHIHDFAKITAIADTYSALTARRSHRERQLPAEAARSLLKMAKIGILSDRFVTALIEALSLYPVGGWVLLSTGHTCRVVGANLGRPEGPKVSVVFDAEGQSALGHEVIDLARNPGISIEMPVEEPVDTEEDLLLGF